MSRRIGPLTLVEAKDSLTLEDYASIPHLSVAVKALRDEAARLVPALRGCRIAMLSSTARGGGVAEMLPRVVGTLNELGLKTTWYVMEETRPGFFDLTKRIHNAIHDAGTPRLGPAEKDLFEAVSRDNAAALGKLLSPGDLLIVHDPQPAGVGALLKAESGLRTIWRCHIGLDRRSDATRDAWEFLRPHLEAYDGAVFSAPEYIPTFLAGLSDIIHPAIDPLTHKNRDLTAHKLTGILCNAGLMVPRHPVLTSPFEETVRRVAPDGTHVSATVPEEIGLLYRPIVLQVSRWDRLKGFVPLLRAFVDLKRRIPAERVGPRHRARLRIVRLVLAGPDPAAIQDDPEAIEVLEDLTSIYRDLDGDLQKEIAILLLPMGSRKENALIVNALQRCATVVVQNSIQEGFGLTITEAMWKRLAIVASRACGPRQQVRDGIDGLLVADPTDLRELADALDRLLEDPVERSILGGSAQRRAHDDFLIFTQVRRWLRRLHALAGV